MKKVVLILLVIALLAVVLSCKPRYECGDNKCDAGEDESTCPQDCKVEQKVDCTTIRCKTGYICQDDVGCIPLPGPVCGDGICEEGESSLNCLADCPLPPVKEQPPERPVEQPKENGLELKLSEYLIDVDGSSTKNKGNAEDIDVNPSWKYFEKKEQNETRVFVKYEDTNILKIFFDEKGDGRFDPAKDISILGELKAGELGLPIWWTNYAYNNILGGYYHKIPTELEKTAEEKKVSKGTDIIVLAQREFPVYCGNEKVEENEMCDFSAPNDPKNKCPNACLWDCSCVPLLFLNSSWKQVVIGFPGVQGGPGGPGAGPGAGGPGAGAGGEVPVLVLLDIDEDKIPNNLDKCPNSPKGSRIYPSGYVNQGCSINELPRDIIFIDNDKDYIWDHQDYCIEDPKGEPVAPLGSQYPGCTEKQMLQLKQENIVVKPHTMDKEGFPIDLLDSDNDGVPNNLDRCQNTRPGTQVFPVGYALAGCAVVIYPADIVFVDNDKDGVWDHMDNCMGNPEGAPVVQSGRYIGCTEKQISGG